MKKLLFPLFLSLSLLFTGCNSIYENHHRTTKLIINLPKAANYSSRQIYKGDSLDVNTENATFSVQLKRSDGAILGPYYNNPNDNTIIIPDVTPGIWTVSAFASVENHEDFAFDSKELIIKAGDIKNITLSLTKNLISKIVNITLEKEINKTSYEVGSSIDTSGAEFRVHLSNGYSFVYDKEQLADFEITTEIGFSSTDNIDDPNNLELQDIADSGLFYTIYELNSESLVPEHPEISFRFPIIISKGNKINAKTPIIAKNPSSTYLSTEQRRVIDPDTNEIITHRKDKYEFSVEIAKSAYYTQDNISVNWGGDFPSCEIDKAQASLVETDHDTYISTVTYTLTEYTPFDVERVSSFYNWYEVTNTNNDPGINNEKTVSVSSKENRNGAYLIAFNPDNQFGAAINQNYKIQSIDARYNGSFVYSDDPSILPTAKDFTITIKYNSINKDKEVDVAFRGDEDLFSNFVVTRKFNSDNPIYGDIPYEISFTYINYSVKYSANGNSVVGYNNSSDTMNLFVNVPTILPKVESSELSLLHPDNFADSNSGFDGTYPRRYWSVEESKFFVEGINGDEKVLKGPNSLVNLKSIQLNSISSTGHLYNFAIEGNIDNINIYECDFEAYISIDDSAYKLLNSPAVKSEATSSLLDSYSPYKYSDIYITIPDSYITKYLSTAEHNFKIKIRCIKKPKKEFEKYFANSSPSISESQAVSFYNKDAYPN